jgi:hypothetical protein
MVGGRLRFSAVRNIVNPGVVTAQGMNSGTRLGPALPLNTGKIPPAWDDRPPEGYAAKAVADYLSLNPCLAYVTLPHR